VSVKINSADFQRGGFSEDESLQVVRWLSAAGVDLLEISGGNYEQMSMVGLGEDAPKTGRPVAASTAAREAYFLAFAERLRPLVAMPLMITGGMRSAATMDEALASGACEVVGIGRPICHAPDDCGAILLKGQGRELPAIERVLAMPRDALGPDVDDRTFKTVESFGLLGWFCLQLIRLGDGLEPDLQLPVFDALMGYEKHETEALQRWLRPA
jgi:tRNA-dihydrouridine synthase